MRNTSKGICLTYLYTERSDICCVLSIKKSFNLRYGIVVLFLVPSFLQHLTDTLLTNLPQIKDIFKQLDILFLPLFLHHQLLLHFAYLVLRLITLKVL